MVFVYTKLSPALQSTFSSKQWLDVCKTQLTATCGLKYYVLGLHSRACQVIRQVGLPCKYSSLANGVTAQT